MAKQMHYTKEGYQALVDELDYLKTTRRAEVKEALAVARSYGDLSENSEYDEARNEQAKVESRITELEGLILHAIVVDESEVTIPRSASARSSRLRSTARKSSIRSSAPTRWISGRARSRISPPSAQR